MLRHAFSGAGAASARHGRGVTLVPFCVHGKHRPRALGGAAPRASYWYAVLRRRSSPMRVRITLEKRQTLKCSKHNEKRASYGHSMVVDPSGRILLDLGHERQHAYGTCEIDLDVLQQARRQMPLANHRSRTFHTNFLRFSINEFCTDARTYTIN